MNANFLNSVTNFLKKRTFELLGLLLIFAGIALSISFITYSPSDPSFVYGENNTIIKNFFGIYGSIVSDFLLQSFGIISFFLLITMVSWGFNLLFKKEINKILFKLSCVVLYLISGCIFIYITFNNSFWLVDNGNSGFVGKILYNTIYKKFPMIDNEYSALFFISIAILFFVIGSNINILSSVKIIYKILLSLFQTNKNIDNADLTNIEEVEENNLASKEKILDKAQQSFLFDKNNNKKIDLNRNFKLPTIDLLEKNLTKTKPFVNNKNRPDAEFVEKILLDFGIEGKIKKINNGPVVSLYEFEPAPGIKVSKIINLSDDLARNTSSTSTRVSVIPGKNTVGIEIPNEHRENVVLREIISNEKFQKREIKLPMALGKNISGIPIIGDLSSMPHLLIAGTTGSGKSVCINTIIVSLLYKLSPDICKFILIDPKMLELSSYEGIPHLLCPVITDSKKATSALGWTVREMNSRYKLMSKEGVRNIDGYNIKHKLKMPYIVVVVDEMSD